LLRLPGVTKDSLSK